MDNDDKLLQKLYQKIHKTDYLSIVETKNFNWDSFFLEEFMGGNSIFLLESFEKIDSFKPTIHGNEDVYRIVLKNLKEFTVHINYANPKNSRYFIIQNEMASKKESNDISEDYKKYFSNFGDDEQICFIEFKDSQNRHELTGEVGGIAAQELFSALKNSILDSFFENNKIKKLRGFIIRVDKKEPRRLVLYKKLIEKFMKDWFSHIIIDPISEKSHGLILLVGVKNNEK